MARRRGGPTPVLEVTDPDDLQALSHPIRVAILETLREPASAASVAREIGQTRQLTNYHLKELVRAKLVRRVSEQRKGNFIETLYQAVARAFVVSPKVAWSHPRRVEAMQRQHHLETLVELGQRLQRDAAVLLDRAAFDGEEIAGAGVLADVRFSSAHDRAAFMKEYLQQTKALLERYGATKGERYRAMFAVYPGGSDT